jgi:hypothetical protein
MFQTHPHDETQRITGIPRLHSRRLRLTAGLLAMACLGTTLWAWRATRGHTFELAYPARPAASWPAPQGIKPQSGVVFIGPQGERTLAWVDLEGSVHAERSTGRTFAPLLGVKGTSGAMLAIDVNSDLGEDLVFATFDRQLLAFDGGRGIRLASADWFAEAILGAPVLCTGQDGSQRIALHSASGKMARYDAHTLRVVGHEIYHRSRTRGPASAYDVDGDGMQDLIMGDEAGALVWLHSVSGELSVIQPERPPASVLFVGTDSTSPIRSGVCGYDFTGDGRDDWVYCAASGQVLMCDSQGKILAGWQGRAIDTSVSLRSPTPVLADLDGDQVPEIIVAHPAGSVYAFQAPRIVPGPLSLFWKASADDTIYDEVALADLTGDEVSDVVVVTRGGALAELNGKDGSSLHTWAVGADGSPLIEDLNGDGLLELVAPADSGWAIIETGGAAYPGNTWPTWRGDAGRRGRRDSHRGWPGEILWGLAGMLGLSSLALWVKS